MRFNPSHFANPSAANVASTHACDGHICRARHVDERAHQAVAHPHRAQAYDASRYIIEELKKRVPIWKNEQFTDSKRDWRKTPEGSQVLTMRASGEVAIQPRDIK